MEIKTVRTIAYIFGIFILGIYVYFGLMYSLSKELIEKLILPVIFSMVGIGFIGLTMNKKNELSKIRIDLIVSSLFMGTSGLIGLLYLFTVGNWTEYIGYFSLVFFTAGIVYYLIILVVSIYLLEKAH